MINMRKGSEPIRLHKKKEKIDNYNKPPYYEVPN